MDNLSLSLSRFERQSFFFCGDDANDELLVRAHGSLLSRFATPQGLSIINLLSGGLR